MFRPYPPPRRMGWGGGYMFWLFFSADFFFYRFSRQFVKFPALLKFWPPNLPPGRWTPSDGVGWGLHVLVIFSAEFCYRFSRQFREISRTFEILTPNPPSPGTLDPVGWGGGGGYMFWLFFRQNFFFIDFLGSSWNFPHFWNFDPQPPPPGTLWTTRGGVGKNLFYWFSGHSWVSLTLVDWRQRKRRHYVVGFIVTSFATQRLAEEGGS